MFVFGLGTKLPREQEHKSPGPLPFGSEQQATFNLTLFQIRIFLRPIIWPDLGETFGHLFGSARKPILQIEKGGLS